MSDSKSAWNEAGDRLQNLGSQLKQHWEQQRGEDAGQTKDQVSDAFKKVGEAVQSAFDTLGAAAKDPAVKADVKQTGKSVVDALGVTFTELSGELRKAFDQRKGDQGDGGPEGAPWGTAPDAAASAGAPETPAPAPAWDPPAASPSTAAPAGPQDSGVDGGTAPQAAPGATPEQGGAAGPQDKQDPAANI